MQMFEKSAELTRAIVELKRQGKRIGFVPTMGALHDGHLSLVDIAKQNADVIVMSIFVNPTQFGNPEDLAKYPRTMETDCAMAKARGVNLMFTPTVSEIYPPNTEAACRVIAGDCQEGYEGAGRPGHFNGVATVVSILFNIVQPDVSVFGEKDFQQLKVIEQMVRDLHFPIEIIPGALIRETDGLAMSSRNVRLDSGARETALSISRSLFKAQAAFKAGEKSTRKLRAAALEILENTPGLRLEYLEVVDANTLKQLELVDSRAQMLLTATVAGVRLLDNVRLG